MFGKNRNKKVGLCVTVVTACLVLATLCAVLATPETALAKKPDNPGGGKDKGGDKTAYSVDAVDHGAPLNPDGTYTYNSPTLVSTCSGSTGETSLFVRWPRSPAQCIVVTPTGSSYALSDDPQLTVSKKRGKVIAVQFYIQDVAGPDGIMHSSDQIPVDPPVAPSSSGFALHVHADNVPVWRHKAHTGGPRVEMIGTISVGDIVFTPEP